MSFDLLAPHYRWMEWILAGRKLQRCRTAFLGEDPNLKHILLVGEGNGRFLLECRRRLKSTRITCVDSSRRMLDLARQRLLAAGQSISGIDFVHADALQWAPPAGAYDALVTHFFLDCFRPDQLLRLVDSLANGATPDAVWLLADFHLPETGLRRSRAQLIHSAMYAFFRVVTRLPARALTCPDSFLRARRFELTERRLSDWGLLHTDRWTRRAVPGCGGPRSWCKVSPKPTTYIQNPGEIPRHIC